MAALADDTVNAGSGAPSLPALPTTEVGNIDAINGLLTVNGGSDDDTMNVDDSNPANTAKNGTLTEFAPSSGLALEQGINYSELEVLTIWLATGNNTFDINSTHAGTTTVNTAQGADTVNVNHASGSYDQRRRRE